jgi:Co/Zn/Cd efflux system component
MRSGYIRSIIVTFSINLMCWYYAIAFCSVYTTSTSGWIYGGIMGIVIDWCIISFALPLIKSSIRVLVRKYHKLKFLISVEYFFWLVNFLG